MEINNRFDFKDAEEYSRLSCPHYNQQQSQMVSIANLHKKDSVQCTPRDCSLRRRSLLLGWLAFTLESISTFFQKKRVFNEWMKYGENNVNDDM